MESVLRPLIFGTSYVYVHTFLEPPMYMYIHTLYGVCIRAPDFGKLPNLDQAAVVIASLSPYSLPNKHGT